ncbi:zinc ribbon domain-containing protein [Roseivirga sp. 4D4]|uniref:zinc ribbon domain-containing protein n=1 Tax=Roseivirga sp. 4D4 TaxID=1889784 RepID=UPI0009F62937|nr:zinc ribbon domain-containing protein [Roseivirga sp. 4D4]
MEHRNYKCSKCNNRTFETDTIATTGSGFSKFFDLQNRKFMTVSCGNCGYTELYKGGKSSTITNIFDLFTT